MPHHVVVYQINSLEDYLPDLMDLEVKVVVNLMVVDKIRSGSKRGGGRGASSRDKSTRKGTPSKRGGRGGDRSEMRERGGGGAGAGGENDGNNQGDGKPVEEVKPLEKSANRWVPKSRMQAKKETKVAEDGTIY